MTYGISKLLQIEGEISDIARQGSGSATRSLYGGFVAWNMGNKDDGSDSIAEQIVDETHWDDMEVLILVVCKEKKKVGSSIGMQETVKTCPGIKERINIVPERMKEMTNAIKDKNFAKFAELTMIDSDHFHELCHTTVPPIHYMNEVSNNIVALVKEFNTNCVRAAYTFDAGPNAVIYIPKKNVISFTAQVMKFFKPNNTEKFINSDLLSKIQDLDNIPILKNPSLMPNSIERIKSNSPNL